LLSALRVGPHQYSLTWKPSPEATGYWVWFSEDGAVWRRDQAEFVAGTTHRFSLDANQFVLNSDGAVHVRVTAASDAGESEPSSILAVAASDNPTRVLVIDGNDRWQQEPVSENPNGEASYIVSKLSEPLVANGLSFDSATSAGFANDPNLLSGYDLVIWSVGEDSEVHDSLDGQEQSAITSFLEGGGALILSGAEIGWDLVARGQTGEPEFYAGTLHAAYQGDDGGSFLVDGLGAFENLGRISFLTPDDTVVSYPDVVVPKPGALQVFSYAGGGGGAGIFSSADPALLYLPFPLESVDDPEARASIIGDALESWF
ncbi:MAG: fibronectin type III domain-containing protein, partial [Myxococcales bacterium]|nr:fibronectin type III domain-containing protein [Myxococcales bacterium]